MNSHIENAVSILLKSHNMVIITGAGISTNAGIPDFRGPGGLYSRKDIPAENLFDIDYFYRDPSLFYTNIGELIDSFVTAVPTQSHITIADLEHSGKLLLTVTQNIDGLHQRAGSRKIICAHGDFSEFYCIHCGTATIDTAPIFDTIRTKRIPYCSCGGVMKPRVVFFGEGVIGMNESMEAISHADCVLVAGSSLVVHPVASLPKYRNSGTPLIIVNRGETPYDSSADFKIETDTDDFFRILSEHDNQLSS